MLVIGGGIAAFAAAIEAARAGASVALVDSAPAALRGGNTRHSRNFRYAHDGPTPFTPDRYPAVDFRADLLRATGGAADPNQEQHPELAAALVAGSTELPAWLARNGVALQAPDNGPLPYSRKTAFFLGGGMAAVHALSDTAMQLGVRIRHGCRVRSLRLDGRRVVQAMAEGGEFAAGSFVFACGGAHADRGWLRRHWGEAADGFVNRGTPHSRGELLQWLLAQGATAVGEPGRLYLVAVDARSPVDDGGIVTRVRGMPLGLVVDRDGRRRYDEGADTASTRYSRWGRRLATMPDQIGWLILDAAGLRSAPSALYPAMQAPDLPTLAARLGINAAGLAATVDTYNAHLCPAADPADAAGWCTIGLAPPKSSHALPLSEPPFAAWPMCPGITFAHHGVAVDAQARVRWADGSGLDNGFAAGMIMAANLIPRGYVSGLAVTIGLVFGRIAGREAARHALG